MTIFSRIGARLDLMQEMFRQTGALKPGSVEDALFAGSNASSLRQAVHSCSQCDSVAACQSYLEEGIDHHLENRAPPSFCPNATLQNQLKRIR